MTGPAGSGPLRVGIVITRLEGGAGELALRGALAVDPAAIRPTIITGSGDRRLREATSAGLEVLVEPALRTPVVPASDLAALRRLGQLFTERRFDVVHTHTSKSGALGRPAAARAGIRRIVHTYHGFPFHAFAPWWQNRIYESVERRLGAITDVALCVGTAVAAEAVRRELLASDRVMTIGVTVDGAARAAASAAVGDPAARRRARGALGLPAEGRVVGTVARLARQKAPGDFLAAMTRLDRPDVTGVWIGSGELAGQLARRVGAQPGPRVVLAGERADVLQLLPALDVFVLPSRYEGLPTAIVEAMICGVPVVATAVNAVPDLVVPGETGLLVPPGRPGQLAAAVRWLLDRPEAAARLAAAAAARVSGQYTDRALAAALTQAYCGQPAATRGTCARRNGGAGCADWREHE
ncbi:MAG: glycosyltransferase [Streptosporangiaceae bacterium]